MLMERYGRLVITHPWISMVIIILITAGALLQMTIKPMEEKFENEDFLPDMPVAQAWNDYDSSFATGYQFFVVVRSDDGDLIDRDSFLDLLYLEENLSASDTFREWRDRDALGANPDSPPTALYAMRGAVDRARHLAERGVQLATIMPSLVDLNASASALPGKLEDVDLANTSEVEKALAGLMDSIEGYHNYTADAPTPVPRDQGTPVGYIGSMEEGQLKAEIGELLSYDVMGEETNTSLARIGSYLFTAGALIPELMASLEAIEGALDDAEDREVVLHLEEARADLQSALGEISATTQEARGEVDPIRIGSISSDYSMAAFSLLYYMTADLAPEDGKLSAKGCLVIVHLNYTLNDMYGEDPGKLTEIEKELSNIVDEQDERTNISLHPMGMKLVSDRITEASNESMVILLPIAFIMVVLILSVIYRNVIDVLLNLAVLGMAIIWMYGFGSLMGFYSNPMITAVPVLIIGLGIDYGIHITMRYREEIRKGNVIKKSLLGMYGSVGVALMLATFTTVLAFMSNIASPVKLILQFGVMAAVGIASSFVIMLTFVPSAKYLMDRWKAKRHWNLFSKVKEGETIANGRGYAGVKALNRAIVWTALTSEKKPMLVVGLALILTLGMAIAASGSKVTFDVNDFLPKDLEEAKDISYLMNEFRLGGSGDTGIIVVYGDISDPDLIRGLGEVVERASRNTSRFIATEKDGNSTRPNVDYLLGSLRWTANNLALVEPQNPLVVDYSSHFDMSNGLPYRNATREDIKGVLDIYYDSFTPLARRILYRDDGGEYTMTAVTFTVFTSDNGDAWELYNDLKSYREPLQGEIDTDVSTRVTGSSILIAVITESITNSQIRSLVITMLVSLIVLTIVFYIEERSMLLGTVATLPMAFCVIWIVGTMELVGIPLNVMTITIGSLTVGLGITYGIHITHRFVEDMGESTDLKEVTRLTIQNTGTALFGAAATTVAGFGLLTFSLMPPLQQFGQVTALAIIYSFLSSVIVLPSLLVIWAKGYRRFRKKREGEKAGSNGPEDGGKGVENTPPAA